MATSLPGPNGAALVTAGAANAVIPSGPQGPVGAGVPERVWVADNGGYFTWHEWRGSSFLASRHRHTPGGACAW